MSVLELKVYDILKARFSDQEATVVIEYVEEKINKGVEDKVLHSQKIQSKDSEILRKEIKEENTKTKGETNEGFARIEGRIGMLRGDMNESFAQIRGDMNEGFAQIRGEMKTGFSDVKVEILRWMFGIFMAMMLAILGLYLKK